MSEEKYTEKIFYEEIQTLINGGTINFFENDFVELKISGEEFKDIPVFKFFTEVLNMTEKEYILMQNILDRYNNEEYWDPDIVNNSDYDEDEIEDD